MARDDEGYTLVELVVVMALFSIVMTLITVSFNRIVASSSGIMRSAETDIGGLIGLELLRCDLELAGFGLPWKLPKGLSYQETSKGEQVPGYAGTAATAYNDPPPLAPRAFQGGDGVGFNGSDYLVLKGTAVGMSRTARSWSYLNYSSNGPLIKGSKSEVELIPGKDERAIVLRSRVSSGGASRELVALGQSFTLVFNPPLEEDFLPRKRGESYLVYGVAPAKEDDSEEAANPFVQLAYPYNRADYYLSPKNVSGSCAEKTGVLYKATVDHGGGVTPYPILDCVADLQVLFMLNTSNDGTLVPNSDLAAYDSKQGREQLRELLKEVRVYLLAQDGKRDPGFSYPMAGSDTAVVVGGRAWSKSEFLANNWLHYRWKVYSIVVQPKNL